MNQVHITAHIKPFHNSQPGTKPYPTVVNPGGKPNAGGYSTLEIYARWDRTKRGIDGGAGQGTLANTTPSPAALRQILLKPRDRARHRELGRRFVVTHRRGVVVETMTRAFVQIAFMRD